MIINSVYVYSNPRKIRNIVAKIIDKNRCYIICDYAIDDFSSREDTFNIYSDIREYSISKDIWDCLSYDMGV